MNLFRGIPAAGTSPNGVPCGLNKSKYVNEFQTFGNEDELESNPTFHILNSQMNYKAKKQWSKAIYSFALLLGMLTFGINDLNAQPAFTTTFETIEIEHQHINSVEHPSRITCDGLIDFVKQEI